MRPSQLTIEQRRALAEREATENEQMNAQIKAHLLKESKGCGDGLRQVDARLARIERGIDAAIALIDKS